MHRLVLLASLLLIAAGVPSAAHPNGCPAPCSGQVSSPPGVQLLYVQPDGVGGRVDAYDPRTGGRVLSLPPGMSSADGIWHVGVATGRVGTVLTRYLLAAGSPEASTLVDGRWRLQAVSLDAHFAALVLHSADRTHVAVADLFKSRVVHRLRLDGDFEVDTVSKDGTRLFLIQHLPTTGAPRYLVRLFDLSRGRLASKPLRGPGEPSVMAGLAWSGVGSPDGRWLLTLYLNTARNLAFVHALDLERSSPLCIFLPSSGTFARLKRYGLTLSPDGTRLFATNAAIGAAAEIDLATRKVVRTTRFPAALRASGPTALTGTISRNGRTLYFSPGRDLWAYDAAYGIVRGPYRTGGPIAGFGFGAGDRRVHALRADGRLLSFDAATGRRA